MKNFPLQILGKHDRVIATIEANVRDAEAYFRPLIEDPNIDFHGIKLIYKNVLASHIVMTTEGDGHCLFRALSWTLYGHPKKMFPLRLLSIRIMIRERQWFIENTRMIGGPDITFSEMFHFTSYDRPRPDAGWGDGYNIKFLAIASGRKVFSYSALREPGDFDHYTEHMVRFLF